MGSDRRHAFERIWILYALALGGIASIIIISQIFVQQYIRRQESDSRVINVAGRQRMLSQKISKLALRIGTSPYVLDRPQLASELQTSLEEWQSSHEALRNGNIEHNVVGDNSARIDSMFEAVSPAHAAIVASGHRILEVLRVTPDADARLLEPDIMNILNHEGIFLAGMETIVFQYDKEAKGRVLHLESVELFLLIVSLLIILFELLFIFRPTARRIRRTVDELMESEKLARDMAHEISVLYSSLEKSYQELADIDVEVAQPVVYAQTDQAGNFIQVADAFVQALGSNVQEQHQNLFAWLEAEGFPAEYLDNMKSLTAEGKGWNGEVKVTSEEGDFLWFDTNIIPLLNEAGQVEGLSVVCANKTERKEAEERSQEITREKIEQKLKEQQFRSILILEGQEEERRRISRDIHDGIGQLLTALKFTIESINLVPNAPERVRTVEEAKNLLNQVIREVRRVSFNLTPSALNDYGIASVTKKFCSEVSRLSGKTVIFENRTGFINRLDKSVETNLYRIIQEAVNNAIKYAGAEEIRVVFNHNAQFLNVEVSDDGAGFSLARHAAGESQGSGHGIPNMRERTGFINGTFDLASEPGKGTTVNIHLPLN